MSLLFTLRLILLLKILSNCSEIQRINQACDICQMRQTFEANLLDAITRNGVGLTLYNGFKHRQTRSVGLGVQSLPIRRHDHGRGTIVKTYFDSGWWKKMYDKTRRGETAELSILISIYQFDIEHSLECRQNLIFRVTCSKGTYVQSLYADSGKALGRRLWWII